jgi:biofilm protein TabA
MITASLKDFHRYINLHPLFEKVEKALKTYSFDKPGERIYLEGDKLFAIPALDNAKSKDNASLEAHNRYIDIQVCLEGNETMGWRDRADCKSPKAPFDNEKDIIFYIDKPLSYFCVPAGSFAIFFPEDCHAPLIGEGMIKKVIFKVEVADK